MNLNHSDLPMEEASVPKTEAVPELEDMISNPNQATALDPVQTDSESVAITDPGPGSDFPDHASVVSPETEPEKPKRTRKRKTTEGPASQSDTEADLREETPANSAKARPKRPYVRPEMTVISIDDRLTVQTEADKAKNDLLDLLESYKTGRILTGTIQGVERSGANGPALAVLYHGDFKIIIVICVLPSSSAENRSSPRLGR